MVIKGGAVSGFHTGKLECSGGCRYVVCDSFENPRKVYVWDLEANTAFIVGSIGEANWLSPETGRRGLHVHFTPDGTLHCLLAHCMPCLSSLPSILLKSLLIVWVRPQLDMYSGS